MLPPQALVGAELLLKLHQRGVPLALGHLETGRAIEQLDHVADRRLGRLREVALEPLHDEHDQDLPRQRRAVLEGEQDELEDLLLHRRAEELAAAVAHGRPEVRRQLLRVLVEQDQLRHRPLAQRARRPRGPRAPLLLQQLAVDEGDQLPLHRPRQLLARVLAQVRRQLLGAGHGGGVLRDREIRRGRREVGGRPERGQVGVGVEEEHEGGVDGQLREVQADGSLGKSKYILVPTLGCENGRLDYLIEGTHFPLQVGQAQPADGVAASEADGEPLGLQVERLLADGAGQILCPLRRLDWHFCQLMDGTVIFCRVEVEAS